MLPGWDSVEITSTYARWFTYAGFVALFLLGVFDVLGHIYSVREARLTAAAAAREADNKRADADARIAEAQRGAAEANKATEHERLARVELQKLVAWRTITPEQQKEIGARLKRHFPEVRVAFSVNAGDPEGFAFGTQIAAIAIEAGWNIVAFAPVMNLGHFETGVRITTTGDTNTLHASDTLTHELTALGFDATRSPEIDPRTTDPLKTPLLYVFVGLRPQTIPNQVSKAIASTK